MGGDGKGRPTYYDILNVRSDCSEKDIKNAYVQLSKKFHPDASGASGKSEETSRFVKITEAYQTLSKAQSRRDYDERIKATRATRIYAASRSDRSHVLHRPWEIKPDYHPNPGPYYGIKGLNKTTNLKVAAALMFLGIAGGIFGFFSVRHSFALNQKALDDVSAKASEHHKRIRAEVENSTKDEQLQRVIDRMAKNSDR